MFYTDDWDAFAKVLPKERHIIGKTGTVAIERDNSNTRHNLSRFTRKTKVVSKSKIMVDLTISITVVKTNDNDTT
jgi:insertion element IS1 protein InsB